jgi:hypothetical protein
MPALDPLELPGDVRLPRLDVDVVSRKTGQFASPQPEDEDEDVAGIQRVLVAAAGVDGRHHNHRTNRPPRNRYAEYAPHASAARNTARARKPTITQTTVSRA